MTITDWRASCVLGESPAYLAKPPAYLASLLRQQGEVHDLASARWEMVLQYVRTYTIMMDVDRSVIVSRFHRFTRHTPSFPGPVRGAPAMYPPAASPPRPKPLATRSNPYQNRLSCVPKTSLSTSIRALFATMSHRLVPTTVPISPDEDAPVHPCPQQSALDTYWTRYAVKSEQFDCS